MDVGFYYSHRLLHHPRLYAAIHKFHHSLTTPVAIGAEYAHPVEFLVSNVAPMIAGATIACSHTYVVWLWVVVAIGSTCNGHSGYNYAFSPFGDARVHDYHHMTFKDNYGAIGLLDWLHGTDVNYRRHVAAMAKAA